MGGKRPRGQKTGGQKTRGAKGRGAKKQGAKDRGAKDRGAKDRGAKDRGAKVLEPPIIGLFFSINLRKNIISFCKSLCIISKKRSDSKVCNAERIVQIFGLGAELQLSL